MALKSRAQAGFIATVVASTFLMGSSTHKMETSRMRKHFREPFLGKANVWRAVVCAIWHELALDSQLPRE